MYAITQNGIEKVQTLDATGLGRENVWGESMQKIPCDTKNILLETQGNTLGLQTGNRNYFLDSNAGILVADE